MVLFLLDKSGSMDERSDDTIGGFNSFVRELPDDALVSLYTFSDKCECIYSKVPVREVEPLTRRSYVPCGNTALFDSIGKVLSDNEGAEGIFVILTDGQENSSRKYTKAHVRDLLKFSKLDVRYIGADIEQATNQLGINHTISYDGSNTPGIFKKISEEVCSTYFARNESQTPSTV